MVTMNLPLFFGIKATCRILGANFNEVKTLLTTQKLSGGKTVDGLKISTESICLLLGERELRKKSFLWMKAGSVSKPVRSTRKMIDKGVTF